MTNVITALRQYLLTKTAVTNVLQGGIWPIQVPKESIARPAMSLQVFASLPYDNIEGNPSLWRTRVQVKVWDTKTNFIRCCELRELVSNAIRGQRGTWTGLDVQGVMETGITNDYQDPDTRDWYCTKDYYITHGGLA